LSFYEATAQRDPPGPPLRGRAQTDVCIVGAGYTGLMAALELAERGVAVRVLEAGLIGEGASGRNGGQLGTGQRRKQRWLEAQYGPERARRLWGIAEAAKDLAKQRIARHGIACDLKPGILNVAHRADLLPELLDDAAHLKAEYGYEEILPLTKAELAPLLGTDVYHGGTLDRGAAHLHPLNYALGLARAARAAGAIIHENSRVKAVDHESGCVTTEEGAVTAKHIILAGNAYLGRLARPIAPYIMPINNFIIATEPLGNLARALIADDVAIADTRFVIRYYRLSADGRLLFGGGESYGPRMPDDIKAVVRPHMLKVFPQLADRRIDYAWGGTLAITVTRVPHLGRLGKRSLFAQGFSGHGVAMAGMAGKLMADAMLGEDEAFEMMAGLGVPVFPGGVVLRNPMRVAAMLYGTLKDVV
jgi:gamma-glutamylputrescine oxidase